MAQEKKQKETKKAKQGKESKEADKKINDLTNDLKRVQAEFENFKKRIEKENEKFCSFAKLGLIKKLLPVIDTFEAAKKSKKRNNDKRGNNENDNGLELVYAQLIKVLASEGLSEIDAKGKFDSDIHEAMMQQESNAFDDHQITEIMQKGYKFGDFVIRPAKVKINIRLKKETEQKEKQKEAKNDNPEKHTNV